MAGHREEMGLLEQTLFCPVGPNIYYVRVYEHSCFSESISAGYLAMIVFTGYLVDR